MENIALFPERKELVEKSRFTVQGVSNSYLYKVMNTILRDFKEMLIKENLTKSSSTELKEILKDFLDNPTFLCSL